MPCEEHDWEIIDQMTEHVLICECKLCGCVAEFIEGSEKE